MPCHIAVLPSRQKLPILAGTKGRPSAGGKYGTNIKTNRAVRTLRSPLPRKILPNIGYTPIDSQWRAGLVHVSHLHCFQCSASSIPRKFEQLQNQEIRNIYIRQQDPEGSSCLMPLESRTSTLGFAPSSSSILRSLLLRMKGGRHLVSGWRFLANVC